MQIEENIQPEIVEDNLSHQNKMDNVAMPSPNDPPCGVGESITLWFASLLFILFIPVMILMPYLASFDPPIVASDQVLEFAKSDPTAITLQIVGIIPAHILTIFLAWFIVTRFRKYSFTKMLGWESGGFRWWHYIAILVAFMAIAIIVGHFFPEQENDLIRILQSSKTAAYVIAFVATFTAPFVEELVYRGVLYSSFQRSFGVPTAFVAVTLMFAVIHVPQYYPSYSTIFLLTLLSITLTAMRVYSNNLLPCVIFHTIFNGLQSIFILTESNVKFDEAKKAATVLFLQ